MNLLEVIESVMDEIGYFRDSHGVEVPPKIVKYLIRTVLFKWDEIQFYSKRRDIDIDFITESTRRVLERLLMITDERTFNYPHKLLEDAEVLNSALALKDCDHYPYCDRPTRRM